jgi:hypothetical protein
MYFIFFYNNVTFLQGSVSITIDNGRVYILMANLFQILNQFVTLFRQKLK